MMIQKKQNLWMKAFQKRRMKNYKMIPVYNNHRMNIIVKVKLKNKRKAKMNQNKIQIVKANNKNLKKIKQSKYKTKILNLLKKMEKYFNEKIFF